MATRKKEMKREKIEEVKVYEVIENFMWNDEYIKRGTKGTFEKDYKELLKQGFIK